MEDSIGEQKLIGFPLQLFKGPPEDLPIPLRISLVPTHGRRPLGTVEEQVELEEVVERSPEDMERRWDEGKLLERTLNFLIEGGEDEEEDEEEGEEK